MSTSEKYHIKKATIFSNMEIDKMIKTEHRKSYFYHVSPHLTDDEILFRPQIIGSTEPDISHIMRICVAPTVEQCLTAICQHTGENYTIYRTIRKLSKTWVPVGVADASVTQERWIMRPIKMIKVGMIYTDGRDVEKIVIGGNIIPLDFDSRGSVTRINKQYAELHSLRKLFKKHDDDIFFDKKNVLIHQQQRAMNLQINRGRL